MKGITYLHIHLKKQPKQIESLQKVDHLQIQAQQNFTYYSHTSTD